MSDDVARCPCDSGQAFKGCCQAVIESDSAVSAEQLMRSRYTAFVLGDAAYLIKTWHSDTCPNDFQLGQSRWLGLHIVDSTWDTVSFEAAFLSGGKGMLLKETSRFVSVDGHWRYVDGDCDVSTLKRNEPCFCGSGKKFKACCGHPSMGQAT